MMKDDLLSPIEQHLVAANVQGVNHEISIDQARGLLESGQYHTSFGNPLDAAHYRRSLADCSCLHLVVHEDKALLHCDRFDPQRNLVSLALHLLTEARHEAIDSLATAWLLLCLAAR